MDSMLLFYLSAVFPPEMIISTVSNDEIQTLKDALEGSVRPTYGNMTSPQIQYST